MSLSYSETCGRVLATDEEFELACQCEEPETCDNNSWNAEACSKLFNLSQDGMAAETQLVVGHTPLAGISLLRSLSRAGA